MRGTVKFRTNGAGPAGAGGDVCEVEEPILDFDSAQVIQQVPATWHPQYGVHVGLSMGTLLLVVVVLGFMAFATQLGLLFWGVSLAVAVMFISIVYPGWIINSLDIAKSVPDTGIVAQPLVITYTVTNLRRYLPVYSIRLVEMFDKGQVSELPRIYIPYIGVGQSCTFQILVTPTRRGSLTCLGTRIASKYPFGLLTRFRTEVDKREVTVYPALGRLTGHALPANRQNDYQLGLTQPKYRGTSDEFYALREYRAGDSPRLIHWKRSARMGRLVVREMSQYSPNRLTVILDTFLSEKSIHNVFLFEHMVSFTATVLCHSLERGYRAGLICTGLPPLMVPPMAGREVQHRILRTLSAVEPQFDNSLVDLFHNWRFTGSWSGRCFIITLADPGTAIAGRLSEVIGPVQVFVAGSQDWRAAFVPPECLKSEDLICNV